jgi:hypothetical protein
MTTCPALNCALLESPLSQPCKLYTLHKAQEVGPHVESPPETVEEVIKSS